MKNTIKVLGVIALAAIIGFSMATLSLTGCDTGGGGGGGGGVNLAGTTWKYTQLGETFTLTFTATTVKMEYPGITMYGTYTLNGNSGSIIWNEGGGDTFVVNGNTLTVIGVDTNIIFVKGTGGGTPQPSYSLDGTWQSSSSGSQIFVSGSTGVLTYLNTTSAIWNDALNKGYVYVGMEYWRNLSKTGNLTWSGQYLSILFYTSSPNVAIGTEWRDFTFTMSANGQTLTMSDGNTWTKRQQE